MILLLDYAALDDITTGNEPASALTEEYIIVIVSIPLLAVLNYHLLRKKSKR